MRSGVYLAAWVRLWTRPLGVPPLNRGLVGGSLETLDVIDVVDRGDSDRHRLLLDARAVDE